MHEAARFLGAEMVGRGPADIESAFQMDRDDGIEIRFTHAVENLVAQDAGIVDHDIDLAELVDRLLDDPVRAVPFADAIAVHHGLAAGGAYLVHDLEGRAGILALAADRTT